MPYYLAMWSDSVGVDENILRNILYRDGLLHEEAELLLRQELPDPRQYFSVLEALARGCTRNNEIVRTRVWKRRVCINICERSSGWRWLREFARSRLARGR